MTAPAESRGPLGCPGSHGAKAGNRTNLAEESAVGATANGASTDAFVANVLPAVRVTYRRVAAPDHAGASALGPMPALALSPCRCRGH